jgi:uncharacterized iron-regulated membrane protein
MKVNWKRLNRKVHYWGAIIIALPVVIVIITGLFLQLKKEFDWIQPPTFSGQANVPTLTFSELLNLTRRVPEANINSWADINRIDIRPDKGIAKIRAKNNWEIQIDHQTGEVLHVAYRRSDIIESIHDGTFFHDKAKLWLFFPAACILLVLWGTGIYLFLLPYLVKNKNKKSKNAL